MNEIIQMISEINPYCDIQEDSELIEEGILNSLGIMALINMIECSFNITIADEDFVAENFRNLVDIKDLIEKYSGCNI